MKTTFFLLCLILTVSVIEAVSIEQIGKLAELKTKDDLILEMVRREGLDRSLTTEDVLMLREKGVSERVIEYLLNLSARETAMMPKQEGESVWIAKNLRAFHTRDKKGKPIVMVTNLDEDGKRMGPPPPPAPVEPEIVRQSEPPVREVFVTVRHEEPERYDDEEYREEPYQDSGIPLYPAYGYPYSGSPYPYPVKPHCVKPGNGGNRGQGNNTYNWNSKPVKTTRPQVQRRPQMPPQKPGSAATSSQYRR